MRAGELGDAGFEGGGLGCPVLLHLPEIGQADVVRLGIGGGEDDGAGDPRHRGCAGAGVVCIPTLVASRYLVSGELVPLLTDWQLSSFWLSAIYPHTSRRGVKLQLFIQHLMEHFAGTPVWDQVLIDKGWLSQEPAQLV